MRPTSWEQRAGVAEHEREIGMPLVQSSEHEPQHGGRRVDQEAERRDEGVGVHLLCHEGVGGMDVERHAKGGRRVKNDRQVRAIQRRSCDVGVDHRADGTIADGALEFGCGRLGHVHRQRRKRRDAVGMGAGERVKFVVDIAGGGRSVRCGHPVHARDVGAEHGNVNALRVHLLHPELDVFHAWEDHVPTALPVLDVSASGPLDDAGSVGGGGAPRQALREGSGYGRRWSSSPGAYPPWRRRS
jgi:hypothetical protein